MNEIKKFPESKLAARVISARESRGWSQADLAEAVGIVQQAISKIEDGTTVSPTSWRDVSDALGIDHAEFRELMILSKREKKVSLGEPLPNTRLPEPVSGRTRGFSPVITPGNELVGDKNFPVYAAAMGGDGHQIVTFDAIDYVKRPSILENVKGAYGLYIVGESMVPAFEPSDMALIHPHLPPARDKNVVLYHVPPQGDGEVEAIVKRLVRYNDKHWFLKQYNPATEFTEARVDWTCCHRIVGKYESR